MNKSLVSTIAAATLVGSIGLVYAQAQGTDSSTQSTTQSSQSAMPSSSTMNPSDTTTPSTSAGSMNEDSSLAAQADRN